MRTVSEKLKRIYGGKVYKLSLSSGCSCPNRDGKISFGGCTFCSEGGSGDFAAPFLPVSEQIEYAKKKIASKLPKNGNVPGYIAYFQSYTNTYGDTERLEKLYTETISRDDILILSVGTRPDCLKEDKLDMLSALNRIKPVWVELGLQTIHERTAERINRGYALDAFRKSYRKLKERGLYVVVHVILGLPGESEEDMLDTVRFLAGQNPAPDGIKLQLLHVLSGTKLADEYENGLGFRVMDLDEYCRLVVKCINLLPEETVIHRMTGDGPGKLLMAPLWSADKKRVLNTLKRYLSEAGYCL